MPRYHSMAVVALLVGTAPVAAEPAQIAAQTGESAEPPALVQEIVVVGVPLSGGIPADRIPASVHTLGRAALDQPGTATVNDVLNRRIGGVAAFDSLGNPLQGGLTVRGFTAAPALGEPQGIVVYQGAMRANEAFGDVVQWDLLPLFAISSAQVITGSNPVYGRNSIGGAVALDMKNGFDASGVAIEAAAASFGRRTGTIQYGTTSGNLGFYVGANAVTDDGWRDASPSRLWRGFVDLAWVAGTSEVGLSLTAADSKLTGNGPAPADLLAQRRQAVFTFPDVTDSRLFAGTLRASFDPAPAVTVNGGGYIRHLRRTTRNGDQAEFEQCDDFVGLVPGFVAPAGALCFGAEVETEDDGIEVEGTPTILVGADGAPVGPLADEPDSVFNRTRTVSDGWGASAEAIVKSTVGGMDNVFIAGAALDGARTRYSSGSDLGILGPDRGVESLDLAIGNEEFNVGLRTRSRTYSVYVSDTLSLAPRLHLTAAVRWNRAELRLRDQIGTALDGDHVYSRVNPALGAAWKATSWLTTYVSYAQNNRIPTPAELSCADPQRPCRFPNAFLADPPLEDVKARTLEAGARGRLTRSAWTLNYSLTAFATRSSDDIIFLSAGPIVGTGFFDNVGRTRRAGIEASLEGTAGLLSGYFSYALVNATFQSALTIQAPDNPAADDDGEIEVRPGDRIPAIPKHSLKAGAQFEMTDRLTLGAEVIASSSRYLRGDEANLQAPIEGFGIVNATASYRRGRFQLFGRLENLFDAEYDNFGLYGDAGELGFENPRFLSPGAPRTFLLGLRANL